MISKTTFPSKPLDREVAQDVASSVGFYELGVLCRGDELSLVRRYY